MKFTDEEIAVLKQSQRILKEMDKQKREGKVEKEAATGEVGLEEMIEHIKNGYAEVQNKEFIFKTQSYLNGRISLPMIQDYFEEAVNTSEVLALKNEIDGVSFICNYMEENILTLTFDEFREEMEKRFKDMDLYLEWMEKGNIKKDNGCIAYGAFKTSTAKGYIYNLIFFSKNLAHTRLILGNFNCFYEEISTWENLIKGMIHLLEVNM